ncbi:MAG: peptidoglycan DD-metalloendopeptidase family protein [Chloroflexota bacterium]
MLLLLTLAGAFPAGAADPWKRQKDDPIAVARRRREAIHTRIVNQTAHIARLKQATGTLTVKMDRTDAKLADLTTSLAEVELEVASAQASLDDTQAQHDELAHEVDQLDWNLDQLSDQADELAADLDDRKRQLGDRLAEAYRTGKTPMWEQVIGSGSFLDVVETQGGLIDYAQRDQQLAAGIERDQAALDVRRRSIRQLRWETDQLRESVGDAAAQLVLDRTRLRAAQARLQERQASTQALLDEQQADYDRMTQTRAELAALIADQKLTSIKLRDRIKTLLDKERHSGRLPSAFNGRLRWPLKGEVSQEFGCTGFPLEPPYQGCAHFHRGIDIVRGWGDPVVAAGDGVILFVGYDPDEKKKSDASWSVVIGHSDRLVTVYGHLIPRSPSGIREGARVREGQTIGWVGNTGNSTGAHLHWGVWYDDEPVNPRFFL